MFSLLALGQSQTSFSSVLTTFSRDLTSLSAYNRLVSSANHEMKAECIGTEINVSNINREK